LAMATIMACGGFAAVCGSSLASAATMSKVAMPQMRRYGYADSLATGTIASGGTLGIIIPPSINLVLFGIMTGTDVGKLFIAGIIPGIMTIGLYLVTIWIVTSIKPELGPPAEFVPLKERFSRLKRIGAIGALFILIIGGIYVGLFTPTEAGAIGAFGAFLFALWRRVLTIKAFFECLIETAKVSSMLMTVLVGAMIFSNFLNLVGLPDALSNLVIENNISPTATILIMVAILAVLGCILETLSMLLLMVPIFFPIILTLGFNPIWFGILFVMVMELGLITPPIGLNLFVIKSMVKDISMKTIYKGIIPFIIADITRIIIVILLPGIVLFLPLLGN